MAQEVEIDVKVRGPFADTRATRWLMDTADDAEEEVGERASALIHARLRGVLQHPTGRYESTVRAVRKTGDMVVDGEGTVYGRWLEGTSTRNDSTRFKGYVTFRIVGAQTDREAEPITERQVRQLGRRLS